MKVRGMGKWGTEYVLGRENSVYENLKVRKKMECSTAGTKVIELMVREQVAEMRLKSRQ